MPLQIEYEFTLPTGLVEDGTVHKRGAMRLATAADEILPQKDPRVQNNPAYLDIALLSRVIKFHSLPSGKNGDFGVEPALVEKLFVQDLAYLQELYRRINMGEALAVAAKCPGCKEIVETSLSPGEAFAGATPETEFKFSLPCGFLEETKIHKDGVMRLATAGDEILPQKDPRVQTNPAYLPVIVLSRVMSKLGSLPDVNPRIVEGLFVQDLHFLEDLYRSKNGGEELSLRTRCQNCQQTVEVNISPGESQATPSSASTRR
jgi:hypothetical protein